jgi:UDP-N-acetylglucosamine pyrophosphorylase
MGEEAIAPVEGLPRAGGGGGEFDPELLAQTVVIKLNGGLGTSMGLQKAKSLLEVKDGATFLDLIVRQILVLRERTGAQVKFLLMNSFSTSEDTLAHLSKYAEEGMASAEEVEMMQNQVPKVDTASLAPVTWEEEPGLEWCPPGHGDLYPALSGSGMLDKLLEEGVRYAFVSNSDNLGAVLDAELLGYFARGGAPFLMEVTRRTESDKKGGHLAVRRADGHLVLREVAQCPEEDVARFQDISVHRFFNTNNLWLRLDVLKEVLEQGDGVLPLPMICNSKTVDPRDKGSTPVFQLETAMGAAIECFDGAAAVEVPRSRFAPVKSTGDLLALRSDAYEVKPDGGVGLVAARRGVPPVVILGDQYKLVDRLDALGVPSLVKAASLELDGEFVFGAGVVVVGDVRFVNRGAVPAEVPGGVYCDETREF